MPSQQFPIEPRARLQDAVHTCVADLVLMSQRKKTVLATDVERLVKDFCRCAYGDTVEFAPAPVQALYQQALDKPEKIFSPPDVAATFSRLAA